MPAVRSCTSKLYLHALITCPREIWKRLGPSLTLIRSIQFTLTP